MPWVKIEDSFLTHPKALTIGKDGRALWFAGLLYSARELTDGFIPQGALGAIAGTAAVRPSAVKKLTAPWKPGAEPLWHEVEGGWQIHDYHDYQPSAAAARAKSKARSEAGRRGGKRSKPPSKTEANDEAKPEANEKLEAKQPPSKTGTPSPSPTTRPGGDSHVQSAVSPTTDNDGPPPAQLARAVAEARSTRLGGGHRPGWLRSVANDLDPQRLTELADQGKTPTEIDLILDGRTPPEPPTPHPAVAAASRPNCPTCDGLRWIDVSDTEPLERCPDCNTE